MKIKISEKSGMISKAIIFQIAMSIFGMMLTSSVIAINEQLVLFAGIFSFLFYFALIGAAVNEDGLKDNIRVVHGRAKSDALLGMKYIALSYIPTFAVTVLFIVLRCFGLNNGFTFILNMLIRFFLSGMYLGFDRAIFADGDVFLPFSANGWSFLIYQVFSVVVCGLIYYIGLRGISLVGKKKEE